MWKRTLHVANLADTVDDRMLETSFQAFEPISCKVIVDKESGQSKGFGFVEFKSAKDAERAHKAMDKKALHTFLTRSSRAIGCGFAGGSGSADQSR